MNMKKKIKVVNKMTETLSKIFIIEYSDRFRHSKMMLLAIGIVYFLYSTPNVTVNNTNIFGIDFSMNNANNIDIMFRIVLMVFTVNHLLRFYIENQRIKAFRSGLIYEFTEKLNELIDLINKTMEKTKKIEKLSDKELIVAEKINIKKQELWREGNNNNNLEKVKALKGELVELENNVEYANGKDGDYKYLSEYSKMVHDNDDYKLIPYLNDRFDSLKRADSISMFLEMAFPIVFSAVVLIYSFLF